jgi:hypothetical protein
VKRRANRAALASREKQKRELKLRGIRLRADPAARQTPQVRRRDGSRNVGLQPGGAGEAYGVIRKRDAWWPEAWTVRRHLEHARRYGTRGR